MEGYLPLYARPQLNGKHPGNYARFRGVSDSSGQRDEPFSSNKDSYAFEYNSGRIMITTCVSHFNHYLSLLTVTLWAGH